MDNLKVIKVKEITTGAGLNDSDFDAALTNPIQTFFIKFRKRWNTCHKDPQLELQLKNVLLEDDEPLLLALKLFANCPEAANVKCKSLAFMILSTICKLAEQQPNICGNCDDNTKMIAFNLIKTAGIQTLNKAIMVAYNLRKIRDILLPKLRELLQQGLYKDCAYWAIYLELTHEFDIFDLVFPLILQTQINLAEDYLEHAKHLRLPLITFLDTLLHRDKSVIQQCEHILPRYAHIQSNNSVLNYRSMSKLVTRLARKYKFDETATPNYKFTKTCSYLHFLHREFQKGLSGLSAYRELIKDHASSKALQIDLVSYVALLDDVNETLYWLNTFKLSIDEFPQEIKCKLTKFNEANNIKSNEFIDENFLQLELSDDSIIIVNNNETFENMLKRLVTEQIVYFDSEWKQSICDKNRLCLIQIAVSDYVYLIDCLATTICTELWRTLGAEVFNNVNIIKTGFCIQQDLHMMHSSLPLQLKVQASNQYLDLRSLWIYLKNLNGDIQLPYGSIGRSGDALNDLTIACLGKKLNKSDRCSNWANRPLRNEQLHYAALDAYCLLLIYKTINEVLREENIPIEWHVEKVMNAGAKNLFKRVVNTK